MREDTRCVLCNAQAHRSTLGLATVIFMNALDVEGLSR